MNILLGNNVFKIETQKDFYKTFYIKASLYMEISSLFVAYIYFWSERGNTHIHVYVNQWMRWREIEKENERKRKRVPVFTSCLTICK